MFINSAWKGIKLFFFITYEVYRQVIISTPNKVIIAFIFMKEYEHRSGSMFVLTG